MPAVTIRVREWAADTADLLAFDRRVHAAEDSQRGPVVIEPREVGLSPNRASIAAQQIRTRYQRYRPIQNAASLTPEFERVLARHRELHDLTKPLVRADYDHGRDTWQWVLRVDLTAGLAVQVAALFHDIERLHSEATKRVEHRAPDYQQFKDAHALHGAELTREALTGLGLDEQVLDEVTRLVAAHERPLEDPQLLVLNDADALSFFALNSWGFFAYFGVEHTRKKVAYTLGRMRPSARQQLVHLRHHPQIAYWLAAEPQQ